MIMKNKSAVGTATAAANNSTTSFRKTPRCSTRNQIIKSSIECYNVPLPKSMIRSTPAMILLDTSTATSNSVSVNNKHQHQPKQLTR